MVGVIGAVVGRVVVCPVVGAARRSVHWLGAGVLVGGGCRGEGVLGGVPGAAEAAVG